MYRILNGCSSYHLPVAHRDVSGDPDGMAIRKGVIPEHPDQLSGLMQTYEAPAH